MKLSEELKWRGFADQSTLADLTELDRKKWTFYHGFDASAPSQTVGNLAAMMLDRVLMRHGHKAIILAGGATSLIGDAGGKDSERVLQDDKTVAHNVKMAEQELKRVFRGHKFTMVNNLDWTKNLTAIEFLRDIGKHFSMTPLIQRDYIARRIGNEGSGISYTEFSYTLLQGMDYLHLYDKYGVNLQIGGSDQWGNCLSGVELIRRVRGQEVHALTLPLVINTATGKKFGKSEEGAVWLDPELTSPTQFYQFWVNANDEGVEDYLKIYTELDKPQVDDIMARHGKAPSRRIAQTELAKQVTALVHGQDSLATAIVITDVLTGVLSLTHVSKDDIAALRREIAHCKATTNASIVDVLADTGLASSKTDARRLLAGGAIFVNGTKVSRDKLEKGDFQNGLLLLRRGKAFKDSALVELS